MNIENKLLEINDKIYILQKDENGIEKLLRFNEKYNTLIEIKFMNVKTKDTEGIIIETLSKQYIKRLIKELESKK